MTVNIFRAAYLVPVIVDFYLSADTLADLFTGVTVDTLPSLRFASVAFAWGVLLLLGLRRPLDRAWILWPTILVVTLVSLSSVPGYGAGELPAARLALSLGLGAVIVALCLLGISYARRASGTGLGSGNLSGG